MEDFVRAHQQDVIGVLNGFDRLVLRGTLRRLALVGGMASYLHAVGVLLKDFGTFADQQTKRLREASMAAACRLKRQIVYLSRPQISKEETARAIAEQDSITEGLVCILKAVESCQSFGIYRNRETGKLDLEARKRQGLVLYHYSIDPTFGFMNARIQTWFPFSIQVCLNGREWLARQMDARDLRYERCDNCFVWIADVAAAQSLMAELLRIDWPSHLEAIADRLNPARAAMLPRFFGQYYWTVFQSEWATDVMFRNPEALAEIYRPLVRSSIAAFGSEDVMRFLGRKPHGAFQGEVISSYRCRTEGVRIRHTVQGNSIKAYDKAGQVLRIETTINNARGFKVYRPREGDRKGQLDWRPMRKGIADLHRRAQVSQAANDRYAGALATVEIKRRLGDAAARICAPVTWKGARVRGLRPFSADDHALFAAVACGEFAVNGLRNRDLLAKLHSGQIAPDEMRRLSGRMTRKLRLLRAHGIIRKVPRSHRYTVTPKGREILSAFLHAHEASVNDLVRMAA
jgi:hypothetical protein